MHRTHSGSSPVYQILVSIQALSLWILPSSTFPEYQKMMFFTPLVYVSGYLCLLFMAVCMACGLYYLAEVRNLVQILPVVCLPVCAVFGISISVTVPLRARVMHPPSLRRSTLGSRSASSSTALFRSRSSTFW